MKEPKRSAGSSESSGTTGPSGTTGRSGTTRPSDPDESKRSRLSRRELLKKAGAAGAAALIPGAAHAAPAEVAAPSPDAPPAMDVPPLPSRPPRGATAPVPAGPLVNLTAEETEVLSAMVDRLIPSDDLGPGALEAGALRYIDRVLSEADSGDAEAYRSGLAALNRYSRYSRGARFVELPPREQDSLLVDVQLGGANGAGVGFVGSSGLFFNMVKSHTWQGTFGDPHYGGNADFIGWDILDYPGVRMGVNPEDQRRLEAGELEPVRRSAYDYGLFQ